MLSEGYLFLRRLDHRLRIECDRSIDTFEAEPGRLDGIARSLGYGVGVKGGAKRSTKSGEKLLRDYLTRRDKIRLCYEKFFLQQSKAEK